jgi:FlaA1/EpsC-like NDP-sugar epimerase
MKKLIIRNLRACFENNVTFTRLAEFEQTVFKSKDIIQVIIIENDRLIFKNAKIKFIGLRPGEKIHEQMIGIEDAPHTFSYLDYFKILPMIHSWSSDPKRIKNGEKVHEKFTYTSDNNTEWMPIEELQKWIQTNRSKVGSI